MNAWTEYEQIGRDGLAECEYFFGSVQALKLFSFDCMSRQTFFYRFGCGVHNGRGMVDSFLFGFFEQFPIKLRVRTVVSHRSYKRVCYNKLNVMRPTRGAKTIDGGFAEPSFGCIFA